MSLCFSNFMFPHYSGGGLGNRSDISHSSPLWQAVHKFRDNMTGIDKYLVSRCKLFPPLFPPLTKLQTDEFTYLCVRWSLFADCDYELEKKNSMDDEANRRRAQFLGGQCPLSPKKVLVDTDLVSDVRQRNCSERSNYTGNDAASLYAAGINRTACLLEDFEKHGKIDCQLLLKAFQDADDVPGIERVLINPGIERVLSKCAGIPDRPGHYRDLSPDQLISCWARYGVLSCIQEEAEGLARSVPETCSYNVTPSVTLLTPSVTL